MRLFLEEYYERTNSDDVGSLLGDLQFSPEGKTFDPAAWNDWIKCVHEVLEKEKKTTQATF
jgi:hypothetical protein